MQLLQDHQIHYQQIVENCPVSHIHETTAPSFKSVMHVTVFAHGCYI